MITVVLAMASAVTAAPPPAPSDCDAACERRAAAAALARGEIRPAVERLREAVARHPDDSTLPLWLARAYLLDDNLFWAERTLRAALERQGESARLRLWLACIHLRQGDLELAEAELRRAPPLPEEEWRARQAMLEAFRLYLAQDPAAARRALEPVGRRAALLPEDRPVWAVLQRRLDRWWLDPVSGDIELAAGRTSNALAGAPTDPGGPGAGSALADLTLRARLAPPVGGRVRPVLDVEAIGHGVRDQAYRELSSLQAGVRLGAVHSAATWRLLAGVRAERLHLDQSPSRYAEALRGEVELERAGGWLLFAGGGHRSYRDERRTRQEWEAGAGGPFRLLPNLSIVAGATARLTDARLAAYDQRGATLALAARFGLGRGVSGRVAASGTWEDFPHSGGRQGLLTFGSPERRRDLSGKLTVGVWLRPWRGVRAGVEWQLARRDSTADDTPGFDFDYRESRARVVLRWVFRGDPWGPREAPTPADHVPLPWGLGAGDGGEEERIIDLLRQDEELRRGSSCGV